MRPSAAVPRISHDHSFEKNEVEVLPFSNCYNFSLVTAINMSLVAKESYTLHLYTQRKKKKKMS